MSSESSLEHEFYPPNTVPNMCCSYIKARDPSILSYHVPPLPAPTNLQTEFSLSAIPEHHGIKDVDRLTVFLRIKDGVPFEGLYEINANTLTCNVPEGSYYTRNLKTKDSIKKMFKFTKIFNPSARQVEVFDYMVKPRLVRFINGMNSTLFTYGVSGSGKTFTIVGTPEEPGLIPRSLEYIFRTLATVPVRDDIQPLPGQVVQNLSKRQMLESQRAKLALLNHSLVDKPLHEEQYRSMQQRLSVEKVADVDVDNDVNISVWVSFAEIYNENVYDLLTIPVKGKKRQKLRLGLMGDQTYIKDLTLLNVASGLEAYQILQFGLHNLIYASTLLNRHSSRSHSIFTIKLVQWKSGSNDVCISTLNFCDLAGSERLKKSENVGDRLKESNNINKSLLVLGRCIDNIRTSQKNKNKPIPFRDSKLTQLFQKPLLGNEDMYIIVNINPSLDMFDETQHALNFSAIAQDIVIIEKPLLFVKGRISLASEKRASVSSVPNIDQLIEAQEQIKRLQQEIDDLNIKIEQMNQDHNNEMTHALSSVGYDLQNFWRNRVATMEKEHKQERKKLIDEYERKIKKEKQELIRLYENKINQLQNASNISNGSVIILNSSTEGDDDINSSILSDKTESEKDDREQVDPEDEAQEQLESEDNLHHELESQDYLKHQLEQTRKQLRSSEIQNLKLLDVLSREGIEISDNDSDEDDISCKLLKL